MTTLDAALREAMALGAPRVYVDANLPAGVVRMMRHDLGWDVLFVLEHADLRRAADHDHFNRALALGRTLITLDRDFLDDRKFPPALSPGVIVCSAADDAALARLLRHADATWLHTALPGELPLRGRKIALTIDQAGV
jgi:predicted nuclease of predicted toxin-antitoxin system